MSVQKIMYMTAVPFNYARLQPSGFKNIGLVQSENNNNNPRPIPCVKRIAAPEKAKEMSNLRIIRKKQNIFKNKADAHAFREKARLKRELLEKQLLDLKLDKMRLLWENERLKVRQNLLEEENLSLKQRLENTYCKPQNATSAGTLKHASFVNFPLPKERVLPQMFALLMVFLGEIFHNLQVKSHLIFQASNVYQFLSKCVKSVAPHLATQRQTMCLSVP